MVPFPGPPPPPSGQAVEVRRTIAAKRERVFAAWTRAEEMKRWSGPGPMTVPICEVDLRVGGRYRLQMRAPDGATHTAFGSYREIDPPKRLVYTWSWEENPAVRDSVVTVEFIDRGNSTEVVLRHEGLPTEKERTDHENGWTGALDRLVTLLA